MTQNSGVDLSYRTPLLDCFRRGEVPRDIRLLAARGALAPRAQEQLALLVWLVTDVDPQIAAVATATLDALPRPALVRFLRRADVGDDVRAFFAGRGVTVEGPVVQPAVEEPPLLEFESDEVWGADEGAPALDGVAAAGAEGAEGAVAEGADEQLAAQLLNTLSVPQRLRLALKGTREQRSVLIRDPNRVIAAAVLSSPKLSDSEVEAFARMSNVGEDVLRTIGTTRAWIRNYGVTAALVRNPKTPQAISLTLLSRINDRDVRTLATDRNIPEALRLSARKILSVAESRKR